MSNYYPTGGSVGGASGGVGEAYPMEESEANSAYSYGNTSYAYDQTMPPEGQHSQQQQYQHQQQQQQQQYNDFFGEQDIDESDTSSNLTPRTAGGGRSVIAPREQQPQQQQPIPIQQKIHSRRQSTDSGISRLSRSSSTNYIRAVYENAQSSSTNRTGGILHHSVSGSNSGYGGSGSSGYGGASSSFPSQRSSFNSNSGLTSSLRSGSGTSSAGGSTVSMSGNLLVHVQIEEETELELDKNEIKLLAQAARDNEISANLEGSNHPSNNDCSTIGTTKSTKNSLDASDRAGKGYIDGNPNTPTLYNPNDNNATVFDDIKIDQAREKMNKVIFSPPFRRSLFLGTCFVLLGLGILLVLENFVRVKSVEDWMEPHRDMGLGYYGGGIDWTFGSDAPKPIAGAEVDYAVENHISDWARGTSRIPPAASLDGYGSVALSETVMFKDVPLFWGLPFAGGSILESVLGQCLNLVQASDKGTQDGRGDDLHLSTVFVVGRKYLNVDLSSVEGIERARTLALGTSGMADVVYSPLLEVSELFSTMNQGRLFIVVRHPVEREFARFRHLLKWDHGKLLGESEKSMSYAEFAHSDHAADNWMTRTLVRKTEDEELTAKDMHTAKEILRRKALVGLYSDIIGAVRHYARYFGWDNAMNGGKLNKATLSCFENAILESMRKDMTGGNKNLVDSDAQEGSDAWRKIMEKNRFDFELYVYSQQLYKFQIALS